MSDVAILAGCGPSLKDVDWVQLPEDAPVAAINVAIKLIPNPDWFILVDRPAQVEVDSGQAATVAFASPSVRKVLTSLRREDSKHLENVQFVDRHGGPQVDTEAIAAGHVPFDAKEPLFYGSGCTTEFALQYLVLWGFKHIIMVGHDLAFDGAVPYFDGESKSQVEYSRKRQSIERVFEVLQLWRPHAANAGVKMYTHGTTRLSEFCPTWAERDNP